MRNFILHEWWHGGIDLQLDMEVASKHATLTYVRKGRPSKRKLLANWSFSFFRGGGRSCSLILEFKDLNVVLMLRFIKVLSECQLFRFEVEILALWWIWRQKHVNANRYILTAKVRNSTYFGMKIHFGLIVNWEWIIISITRRSRSDVGQSVSQWGYR